MSTWFSDFLHNVHHCYSNVFALRRKRVVNQMYIDDELACIHFMSTMFKQQLETLLQSLPMCSDDREKLTKATCHYEAQSQTLFYTNNSISPPAHEAFSQLEHISPFLKEKLTLLFSLQSANFHMSLFSNCDLSLKTMSNYCKYWLCCLHTAFTGDNMTSSYNISKATYLTPFAYAIAQLPFCVKLHIQKLLFLVFKNLHVSRNGSSGVISRNLRARWKFNNGFRATWFQRNVEPYEHDRVALDLVVKTIDTIKDLVTKCQ